MKFITLFLACAATLAAYAAPYKVLHPATDQDEGSVVYLVNYDTSDKIDSTFVNEEGAALFKGEIDEPVMVRIIASDGSRLGDLILEDGSITISEKSHHAVGSMLNDRFNAFVDSINAIAADFESANGEAAEQAVIDRYYAFALATVEENIGNPIGYYVFMNIASERFPSLPELNGYLAKHPELAAYKRVQRMVDSLTKKENTSAGKMMTDFEFTDHEGKTHRLSDYAGKGRYTLVDFWASWCGPCIREIAVLKEIQKQYADAPLDIVGIAVWDKPEDTLRAAQRLEIPWTVVTNAQNVPTDAYGILGIPCIILFGPDGKIIFRDLQGDELRAAVAGALK